MRCPCWNRCLSRRPGKPAGEQIRLAVQDSYKRLLGPAIEVEMRLESKKKADAGSHPRVRRKPARTPAGARPGPQERAGHRPRISHRLQGGVPGPPGQTAARGRDLPHARRLPRPRSGRRGACALPEVSDRSHRHRQRHRQPGNRNVRARAEIAGVHCHRHGQRKRRLDLFRLRGRPGGVPGQGRHRARRGFHRAPADGSAGRTGEARPEIHRRRPIPA